MGNFFLLCRLSPAGKPNPFALAVLRDHDIDVSFARSKHWDEFADSNAPKMDLIITVCDNAAGETCPVWPGLHRWRTGVFLIQLLCKAGKDILRFGQHTWKWKPHTYFLEAQPTAKQLGFGAFNQ